jgi:hypothetical protein
LNHHVLTLAYQRKENSKVTEKNGKVITVNSWYRKVLEKQFWGMLVEEATIPAALLKL